jgi:Fe-S-cluster containining protein
MLLWQDCIFLEGKQCTVHAAKPLQCSTYPWWPELMEYWAWESERESTCEGLDHPDAGALDSDRAAAQLQAATEHFAARDAAASAPKQR